MCLINPSFRRLCVVKMNRLVKRALILFGLLLGITCAHAEEEMLYWMIDEKNEIEFDYAVVYATTADLTGKTWTTENGYGVEATALPKSVEDGLGYEPVKGSFTTTLDILTELEGVNYPAYSFYIELIHWDEATQTEIRKGVSEVASYKDLTTNHHILGSNLTIPDNLVVWAPTTVPEPTSGALALIGFALLSLRRRHGARR